MRLFSSIQTPDWTLQKIQDNVSSSLNPIAAKPIVDGVLVQDVKLTSGQDNSVSHTIGRTPLMWIVVKKNANADVWEATSPAPSKTLNLWCSANCTVSLWVA